MLRKWSASDFMLKKYGQEVINELKIKHRIGSYKGQLWAVGQMYKQLYEDLLKKNVSIDMT